MSKFRLDIFRIEHQEKPHQSYSFSKIFLLKCFTVFFLLVSFYPFQAYSTPPDFYENITHNNSSLESENTLTIEEQLLRLERQIESLLEDLILVLLSEDTPEVNKQEIVKEIEPLADINNKIEIALTQLSERGNNTAEEVPKDEDLSTWVISQSQLIKRKQERADQLIRNIRKLSEDLYVNLGFKISFIIVGGVLFFVPSAQLFSIALMARTLAITTKKMGALTASISVFEGAIATKDFLTESERKIVSFFSHLVIINPFAKELFLLLYSTDENDKYLAQNIFQVLTSEDLIRLLIPAIGDDKYSLTARKFLIRTLRGFPYIEENLRRETIEALKNIIDNSKYSTLRQFSVSALGKIGEGVEEVAEYLLYIGDKKSKDDIIRLLALIELGRDKKNFLRSIEELSTWFEDKNIKEKRSAPRPEIPDSFVDSLLSTKEEELSENHITVVKGFISSGILGLELQLKFSETLLKWNDSPENKTFLSEVYSNPAEDIISYMKEELFKEGLFEERLFEENLSDEDRKSLEFLMTKLSALGDSKTAIEVLYKIESIIEEFKKRYSNQVEKAEKLENIVNSYKKVLESIQNVGFSVKNGLPYVEIQDNLYL